MSNRVVILGRLVGMALEDAEPEEVVSRVRGSYVRTMDELVARQQQGDLIDVAALKEALDAIKARHEAKADDEH